MGHLRIINPCRKGTLFQINFWTGRATHPPPRSACAATIRWKSSPRAHPSREGRAASLSRPRRGAGRALRRTFPAVWAARPPSSRQGHWGCNALSEQREEPMIFDRDSPIKMDDDWYHSRSPDWSKVTILGCLRGTFRPSRRPDALDPFVVHLPALMPQERRDAPVPITAVKTWPVG